MGKRVINRQISIVYLLIIGICAGLIVGLGVFVAPIIFNANLYLGGDILTKFQSGIVMTEIFVKSNYFLAFTAAFIFIYEGYDFIQNKFINLFALVFGIISVVASSLFIFYFTPQIVEAQSMGSKVTSTEDFAFLHTLSEWDFKILLLSLVVLMFARISDRDF